MLKAKDFTDIIEMIEKKERTKLRVESGFSQKSLMFRNRYGESVLSIKEEPCNPSNKLIISHMSFKTQREGLGSAIFEKLKEYALTHNMNSIKVENATTRPMIEFCKKHNFNTVTGEVFIKEDGYLYGNFILPLEKTS